MHSLIITDTARTLLVFFRDITVVFFKTGCGSGGAKEPFSWSSHSDRYGRRICHWRWVAACWHLPALNCRQHSDKIFVGACKLFIITGGSMT